MRGDVAREQHMLQELQRKKHGRVLKVLLFEQGQRPFVGKQQSSTDYCLTKSGDLYLRSEILILTGTG